MKKLTFIITLLTMIAVTTACTGRGPGTDAASDMAANASELTLEAIPVETAVVNAESVDLEVYTFGYLEPDSTYFVTPLGGGGLVDEIFVSVGDYVEKGTLLYQLETADLDLSKDQSFLQEESTITTASNNLEAQQVTLAQRKSTLESTKLSLSEAKTNYENTLQLFNSAIVSQSEFDGAKNQYNQAQFAYEQAQLNVQSSEVSYNSASATYNNALRNYELSKEDFGERNSDLYVLAPINGLVTEVTVQVNEMNQGNAGVTLIDNSKMVLDVKIMEKYIHSIEEGQTVRLSVQNEAPDIVGVVSEISLSASKGYYPVEISILNDNQTLTSGTFAEGYIKIDVKNNALMVNKTSLLTDNEGHDYIYTIDTENQLAKKVLVEKGLESGNQIEIIGAIEAGDQVVVVGQDFIVDGQPVLTEISKQ